MVAVDPTSGPRSSARYPFPLDRFQLEAIDALDAGHHVVVAAPTGSGKTVVAEYGIEATRRAGRRAFYTAPLKALSNQKFRDLRERYGAGNVGLLTGDNAIDGDAPVVVMTTEVLRNMIYAGLAGARRPRPRRARRGALPAGHLPRAGVGGGHRPPARRTCGWCACRRRSATRPSWRRGSRPSAGRRRRSSSCAGRCTSHDRYLVGDRTNDRLHFLETFEGGRPNPDAAAPRRLGRPRGRRPPRAAAAGQRPAGAVHAGAGRDDRPARAARPAAGDRVHLQPQPVRRGGPQRASPPGCA